MKAEKLKNSLLLVLVALIWGVAFVAQSEGAKDVGPYTFNAVRMIIGGLVLLPCIKIMDAVKEKEPNAPREKGGRTLWLGGLCCGAALFLASTLQQVGILYTTAGKAGFITALYIVLVPVLGLLFGRKTGAAVWISVALAVVGMYFLCMTGSLSLGRGEALCMLCALFFAVHITVIDHFSPDVDGVRMSCIQFFVCGGLSAVLMFLFEKPDIHKIVSAWLPILYTGVLSSGVAYTLQIVAQKNVNPTVASLLMSLESVFSALAGWAILGQGLSGRELFGCVLLFAAIILAQLPIGKRKTA